MRPRLTDYRVRVSERDIPALLDMLRYEQAIVMDWERATKREQPAFLVTLRSPSFTPDRWASFLITPEVI